MFVTPSITPIPILAAEEEEEDNFTTMPNYRWRNQSITNTNVTEELLGDQYIINNTNTGAGAQNFSKSRALNSRDFYFESRFALDIGGNNSLDYATEEGDAWDWDNSDEYWYDEESNVSDFDDGSLENWEAYSANTAVINEDGWLKAHRDEDVNNVQIRDNSISVDASKYKYIAIELYSDTGEINYVIFHETSKDVLTCPDNIPNNTKELVHGEFNSDWKLTESQLKVMVVFVDSGFHTVYFNMTYLYDTSLGDIEGFSHGAATDYSYVSPEGYFIAKPKSGEPYISFYSSSGLTISFDNFDYFRLRAMSFSAMDCISTYVHVLGGNWELVNVFNPIQGIWNEWEFDFSGDSDLSEGDVIDRIALDWDDESGNFEGDEYVFVDYILLTGHWSKTDGFKFSLLDTDDIEGMAFQFTRDTDSSYNISIDMYNTTGGTALDYDYSFDYNIDVDGWLLLRVDWNLDKRQAKITFEFENGTDIIRINRITDLYGDNIGFEELLLLEDGFPSLCINNTIGPNARSYVVISYIDACWVIIDWREPSAGSSWTFEAGGGDETITQYSDSFFRSVSPYGCSVYQTSTGGHGKYYILDIDRFDGLTFDHVINQTDLDQDDFLSFYMGIYNVAKNGSLEQLFIVKIQILSTVNRVLYRITVGDTLVFSDYSSEITKSEGSFSIYYESESKVIMQYKFSNIEDDFEGMLTSIPKGEDFTKEMVVVFGYQARTSYVNTDDIVSFSIGGFEVTRKDILTGLVGMILGPFFQLLAILFSPFILLFQLLTLAFIKAFKDLLSGLEPFFDILGGIFEVAISALGDTFGSIIDGLETAFEGFLSAVQSAVEGIWLWLFGLALLFAEFLEDVLNFLIPILISLAALIWSFLAGIVFWIWATLGLPDLLAILGLIISIAFAAINSIPVMLQTLIDLFLFWHLWILIGIWVIVLPMQAAQCDGVSDFLERILGILCIDCVPFELFGFGGWFPLAIPLIFWTCAEIIVLV